MDKWDLRRHIRNDVRDAILFIAGLLGVLHETLIAKEPREVLLLVFAAMMGLPAFLRLSNGKNGKNGGNGAPKA